MRSEEEKGMWRFGFLFLGDFLVDRENEDDYDSEKDQRTGMIMVWNYSVNGSRMGMYV